MGESEYASAMTSSAYGTGLSGTIESTMDANKTDQGAADNAGSDNNRKTKSLAIIIVIVLLLALSFTLLLFHGAFGRRGGDGGDGDDDAQEGTTQNYDFLDTKDGASGNGDSGSMTNDDTATASPSEADVSIESEWLRDNSPILMCTMGFKKQDQALFIPDGLCSIVVFSGGLQSDNTFYNTHSQKDYFDSFRRTTKDFNRTQLGFDVMWSEHSSTANRLLTPEGHAAMLQYFKEGLRHYGTLDTEIESNTGVSYLTDIISLLQELRSVQREATNGTNIPCFLFYGAALLYHENFDAKMVAAFNKVITSTQPDIVLFQTTYFANYPDSPKCRVTGASLWDEAVVGEQPTFVGALKFRENITLPSRTVEMLSLTVCGRLSYNAHKSLSAMGDQCTMGFNLDAYSRVCPGGRYTADFGENFLDAGRSVMWKKRKDKLEWHVFDNRQTVMTKACKSKMNFGFRGGWVVFNVECSDVGKICSDPLYTDGFAFVHTVKEAMRTDFNSCSITPS